MFSIEPRNGYYILTIKPTLAQYYGVFKGGGGG